jgi:non-haem Fe2+, alpha-ketoglutarate-dependent halogenase
MTDAPQKPQRYQTVSNEHLDKIGRDLHFHPSPTRDGAALKADQIETFNREGYLKRIRLFDDDEAAEIRAYFDDLLKRVTAEGGDSYSISMAHMKYARVWDLLHHPRILDHIADLLGQRFVGWGTHFFCKMPGDGKRVSWHQDASYWPLTPSKTVTLWLAIDDADVGNACMRFIPGSHLKGHLTWRLSEDDEHNVLHQTVENAEAFGDPVDVELRAGECSLHSDLLLHGSEANQSDRRRCGLTLRYCTTDVRAHDGWNAKGVVIRGDDPDGHWGHPPRPQQD